MNRACSFTILFQRSKITRMRTYTGTLLLILSILGWNLLGCSKKSSDESSSQCSGFLREIPVGTSADLTLALNQAQPGDSILLANGTYSGNFKVNKSATANCRSRLYGSGNAIIDAGTIGSGYALAMEDASYWTVESLEIRNAKKGVVLDRSNFNILSNLKVHQLGEEGVHFRTFSSSNTLKNSQIYSTGLLTPGFGEGIYIGSANSNWCTYTNCTEDRSDNNSVIDTTIYQTTAESIDVKEGTTGTLIQGTSMSGAGLSGQNFADSIMDIKGDQVKVTQNIVTGSGSFFVDAFQTHEAVTGWGKNIEFRNNDIQSSLTGYGIRIHSGATGAVVTCGNSAPFAVLGLANISCVP